MRSDQQQNPAEDQATSVEHRALNGARNGERERLFTFASGGWVLALVGVVCLALMVWAVAPAVLRMGQRPPGDGQTIESFGFDLANLKVPREFIAPAMLHRDMVPTLDSPSHSGPDATGLGEGSRWETMQRRNDPKYGKYLVSSDVVIGVTIAGESRCYPLHVMYVHEIVNDTLAGTPIAVTYNWLTDSAMVFDRRINGGLQGTAVLAVSGLVYNSNMLMYDRHQTRAGAEAPSFGGGNEALWSQLLGRPISGSPAAMKSSLTIIPCDVTTWRDWSERHPDTTVLNRDLSMAQRYKDAAPTQYFKSAKVLFPFARPPASTAGDEAASAGEVIEPKTRVLAVMTSEACRVYPITYVLALGKPRDGNGGGDGRGAGMVEWTDTLGLRTLRFIGDRHAGTLRVECEPHDPEMFSVSAFWFAWHAMHPSDELVQRQVASD